MTESPSTAAGGSGEARAGIGLLAPEASLHRMTDDLAPTFAGTFTAETVERYVFESYTALGRTARVQAHLVSLTRRFATDRLTALAQAKGAIVKDVPEVLFVCVHNAGRSQMAAALLHVHAEERVHVRSAGSAPAYEINPNVVAVLAEVGVDITTEFPKPLTDDVVQAADVVVTMGCGDACPVYAGKRYLDWDVTDPEGQQIEVVRAIRDEVTRRIGDLLDEIAPR
ncbi:MAG: arsenate reductase ArsC [Mycobacteriales bacterium]